MLHLLQVLARHKEIEDLKNIKALKSWRRDFLELTIGETYVGVGPRTCTKQTAQKTLSH